MSTVPRWNAKVDWNITKMLLFIPHRSSNKTQLGTQMNKEHSIPMFHSSGKLGTVL